MTMQRLGNGNGNGSGMTLAGVVERPDSSIRFTPEQEELILATCCGSASRSQAMALISIAEARGLNPILGECYFVERQGKWSVQASIDALRIKADQTGLYAGQDEPEYEYNPAGDLVLARVRVYRKDWARPAVGVARWSEYVQTKGGGELTKFWRQMPHNQLAKCAEALALRKAFPAVLSKVYVTEEMQQADNVDAAPRAPARGPTVVTVDGEILEGKSPPANDTKPASGPDLTKQLTASIDWCAWADGLISAFDNAATKGAFNELLVVMKADVEKLQPPATLVSQVREARIRAKARLS